MFLCTVLMFVITIVYYSTYIPSLLDIAGQIHISLDKLGLDTVVLDIVG